MADAPGKDTPQPDSKPIGKSGPVKPPVLEGTARPAGKSEDKPAEKPAEKATVKPSDKLGAKPFTQTLPPRPAPAAPKTPGTSNSGSPWVAGLVGGALGLGAAYGLAFLGLWPVAPQEPAAADPRLAQFATAIPELETVTNTVQDELSTLNGRVSGLETTLAELPEPTPAAQATGEDYADEIAALSARLDELAAAPAPEADTSALDELQQQVAALSEQVSQSQGQIETTQSDLAALSAANQEAAAQTDVSRLPLIFSGLESAFSSGRGYEDELAALRSAEPSANVPAAIADSAAGGLPRPDDVARELERVLPDILAGRPVSADAGWQDQTADWFRGLIAMRPAGDAEGDSPDAIVARLEAAVARRDYAAAQAEFNALPQSMQAAAGTFGEDIARLAEADSFLQDLRSAALGTGAGA